VVSAFTIITTNATTISKFYTTTRIRVCRNCFSSNYGSK